MRTLIGLWWCIFLVAAPANAKVIAIPIEELIARSDEIVLATVTEVSPKSTLSLRAAYASAVVKRTIKGSLSGNFNFLASPTWTCDVSEAVKGETVLLFLGHQSNRSFIIQHSGRGRMPLHVVGGTTYATLWNDVRLPVDAPTVAGPDSKYDFIVSVELSYIEGLISKHRDRNAATQKTASTDLSKASDG